MRIETRRYTAKTISAISLVLQQYNPEKANDSFQVWDSRIIDISSTT